MRQLIVVILISLYSYATDVITPVDTIEVNGTVRDMVIDGDTLVIGTDSGHIEVYDYVQKKKIKEVFIPLIVDFMGDKTSAKIMSVDVIGKKYLLLSDSGYKGYSDLFIHENNKTTQILTHKDKKSLVKARFIDATHILFGYLGNDIALFDLETKKELYKKQLNPSKFSDFMLNEDKTKVVFGCESGVMDLVDVKTGDIIKSLDTQNVDNVYRVAYRNGVVAGAGQDRRGSLYDTNMNRATYIRGSFLIYGTALSPNASKVVFAVDENNDLSVYKTSTKSKIATLKGQKSTLNVIVFLDENRLFSGSDDNTIMVWDLNSLTKK